MNNWIRNLTVFPNFICAFLMALWGWEYIYGSSFNWDLWQWRVAGGYDHVLSVMWVLGLFASCCMLFRKEPLFAVSAFGACLLSVGLGNMLADFLWVHDYTHILTDTFIPELGYFVLLFSRFRFYMKDTKRMVGVLYWALFVTYCMAAYAVIGAPLDFYISPATHQPVLTAYWANPLVGWWEIGMWAVNCWAMRVALRW